MSTKKPHSKTSSPESSLERPNIGSGDSDVKEIPTFQSTGRHTDTTPEDLSQRWHISIAQAIKTLKHTTQKFLRSAILPLSRRYRADRDVIMDKGMRGIIVNLDGSWWLGMT